MNYNIKKWWYTPPNKDASFFVHIRETFQSIFKCSHSWYYHIDFCHNKLHGLNKNKRYCSICGKEQRLVYYSYGKITSRWEDLPDFDKLLHLP
jgi:hypothetical protein